MDGVFTGISGSMRAPCGDAAGSRVAVKSRDLSLMPSVPIDVPGKSGSRCGMTLRGLALAAAEAEEVALTTPCATWLSG